MISFTRLRDIREDNDINQEKMANFLGTKRSTYSLWELGINVIPLRSLCDYADHFDLSLDYLLGLENKRNIKNNVKGLDLKILGENLKNIRIRNNLSQENVADILGVSQACIVRYEKGIICISTSNLYKFSKEFKVPLNELCGKSKYRTNKIKVNV